MPDNDKITFEPGNFNWDAGRGYEAPADGGTPFGGALPLGWNDVPEFHESMAAPMPITPRAPDAIDMIVDPISGAVSEAPGLDASNLVLRPGRVIGVSSPPEPVVDKELEAAIKQITDMLGGDYVDVAGRSAAFEGHKIQLSESEWNSIRIVLATAVCRQMEEERDRIIAKLQLETLSGTGGGGIPNVPEVPGEAGEVEPPPAG